MLARDPLVRQALTTDIEHRSQAVTDAEIGALTAADIAFDGTGSPLIASNVEDAIKEVDAKTGGSADWGGIGGTLADQADLQAALDAKATPGDITAAITGLINAAPAALDTLDELAAALGDDGVADPALGATDILFR